MIGTINIKVSAHSPQMPLCPVFAFQDSYQNVRICDVPKRIGDWQIKRVTVECQFPDNQTSGYECALVGGVWTTTIESCPTAGTTKNGFIVNGYDESGNKYILGKSDLYILTNDSRVIPQKELDVVNILPSKPETPHVGDAVFENGVFEVYDGESWISTGSLIEADDENPNWAKYSRNASVAGYASQAEYSTYSTESESADSVAWSGVQNKPDLVTKSDIVPSENNTGYAANADYADQAGQAYSATNAVKADNAENAENAVYASSAGQADYAYECYMATQAQTAYQADNSYSADEAAKAYSVDWSGVENKPDIPTVNNPTITITQGGATKGAFTLNQATSSTIELDAGGGGGGGCQLHVMKSTNTPQKVSWTDKNGQPNVIYSWNIYVPLVLDSYVHDPDTKQPKSGYGQIHVQCNGILTVDWNGYSSDCSLYLDGVKQDDRPGTIDSSNYSDILIYFDECLEEHTQISMADGTTKMVCDLIDGDRILTLNPDTMELEEDEAVYCDGGLTKTYNTMDVWTFDDGTILKTIHPHQFFNVRTGKMEYIADFQIGDKVRKQDGSETALAGHETQKGRFFHNTLFTKKYNNYFANGVLTGNRKSVKWGWYWIEENNSKMRTN